MRAGGHSVPGYGTCDGGTVIDVAPMKGICVDPEAGTVRRQSGLLIRAEGDEPNLLEMTTCGNGREEINDRRAPLKPTG